MILFLQIRKLRDSQRKCNYSNQLAGFTVCLHHLLPLWLEQSSPSACCYVILPLVVPLYTTHRPTTDRTTDIDRLPSVLPIILCPLFSPFNVPISPRFPQGSSGLCSPWHRGNCYCLPQDKLHCKEDQIWARHDDECRWTNTNRKLTLAKNSTVLPFSQN